MKKLFIALLLLSGCTYNQQRRIAEKIAPLHRYHNMKIIRESLDRPSSDFSFHLISDQGSYILKANHLPINEKFLFASIDGTTGNIELIHEFDTLSDGSLKIFDPKGPRYEDFISLLIHKGILVGKQIDYVLVRKKDCTFATASFLPYPLQAKGNQGELVSLRVIHPMLTRFSLEASGFGSNETLQLIHRSGERIEKMTLTADAAGRVETDLNPTILGKLGGEATLTLVGERGSVELQYPWGARLENQTFTEHQAFPIFFVTHFPHERNTTPYSNIFSYVE